MIAAAHDPTRDRAEDPERAGGRAGAEVGPGAADRSALASPDESGIRPLPRARRAAAARALRALVAPEPPDEDLSEELPTWVITPSRPPPIPAFPRTRRPSERPIDFAELLLAYRPRIGAPPGEPPRVSIPPLYVPRHAAPEREVSMQRALVVAGAVFAAVWLSARVLLG